MVWYLCREADDGDDDVHAGGLAAKGMRRFAPTAEWQEVPEGFVCPPGLEYRMDLSAGRTVARWPYPPP